jgi:hypothetical protein
MGFCSSKILPENTDTLSPAPTQSPRSDPTILMNAFHREIGIFSQNIQKLRDLLNTEECKYMFTPYFYELQITIQVNCEQYLREVEQYQTSTTVCIMQQRLHDLTSVYHRILRQLYITRILKIDERLRTNEAIQRIFGIHDTV